MQTASPEDVAIWITEKRQLITDPEFRALCQQFDAAYDWPPDDPRLPALADRTRTWLATHNRSKTTPLRNPTIARLGEQTLLAGASPAWDRLTQLMKD